MRILVGSSASPDRSGGGIVTYAKLLSESLISRGIEIHFLSPTPQDWSWVREKNIHHVPSNQHDNPSDAAARTLRYIFEHRIDGIINNDNSLLQSIAPGAPCPFIAIGHCEQTSIASLACYRPEWSDYVVAISSDMQNIFVNRHGVPLTKCPIIFNGVEDPGHRGTFDSTPETDLRLVFAGGNNRGKGADLILSAVRMNPERWRGITLDWFGMVPDGVAKQISALPHVQFHGRVPRQVLMNALRDTDVLLFPSRLEGCPMAMIEAMSLGVVPIASDGVGAMRWLITSGKEGYICYLRNWAEQMLDCVAYLRDTPNALAEMKRAARKRYLSHFQIDRVANDLLHLLQQPTVDRTALPKQFRVLHWHRPLRADGLKAPLLDRIRIRFGWLHEGGMLHTTTAR